MGWGTFRIALVASSLISGESGEDWKRDTCCTSCLVVQSIMIHTPPSHCSAESPVPQVGLEISAQPYLQPSAQSYETINIFQQEVIFKPQKDAFLYCK